MAIPDDQADPFNLDALAVSDRFRLFGFTRREDYLAYLWVLRALDRLRAGPRGPGPHRRCRGGAGRAGRRTTTASPGT